MGSKAGLEELLMIDHLADMDIPSHPAFGNLLVVASKCGRRVCRQPYDRIELASQRCAQVTITRLARAATHRAQHGISLGAGNDNHSALQSHQPDATHNGGSRLQKPSLQGNSVAYPAIALGRTCTSAASWRLHGGGMRQ